MNASVAGKRNKNKDDVSGGDGERTEKEKHDNLGGSVASQGDAVTSSVDVKIRDMEWKIVEGKLVFVDDDGVLLPLNDMVDVASHQLTNQVEPIPFGNEGNPSNGNEDNVEQTSSQGGTNDVDETFWSINDGGNLPKGDGVHLSQRAGKPIGVPMQDIENMSGITGCSSATIPFKHLGWPMGNNMNRCNNWEDMIKKEVLEHTSCQCSRCPRWLIGRLKLPEPNFLGRRWYRQTKNIMGSMEEGVKLQRKKGGLGIGSLKALSLALIQKWRWWFNKDSKGIWKNIITSIYDPNGWFGNQGSKSRGNGFWSSIAKAIDQMHDEHIVKYTNMRKSIGNGLDTRFLMELWVTSCIWDRVFRWLDMNLLVFSNIDDIFTWADSLTIRLNRRKVLDAIIDTVLWVILRYQNNKIFGLVKMNKSNMFDDIVSTVFYWCSSRSKNLFEKVNVVVGWLQNPMLHIL
ncbi:RNA-directed DNA polymerase, eukaryota [Artemisia annua]|uniref:RNA-directed DNA polymerase, eukaryota n=1 Tax=Artemisia annua TaxID=35608 RepID=A0A2U1PK44_ARTAN|nr:RNA-directed DNA polymerase, eukaryota [Artemisia annua]